MILSRLKTKVHSLFRPVPTWLRTDAKADLSAALTVAILGIPQAMAFAAIAGLPPVTGLYTSIVSAIVAALLGSSRHLITGPSNVTCMMIFSITAQLAKRYGISPLEIALLISLLSGFMQALMGLLRLGSIVKYISNSVIMGFTTGAGILIALNQLDAFLGLPASKSDSSHVLQEFWQNLRSLGSINPAGLAIAAFCMVLVITIKKLKPRLPGALIALIMASLVVLLLGLNNEAAGWLRIPVIGERSHIAGSLALWHFPQLLLQPDWLLYRDVGFSAFSVAVIGLIQSASIAKSLAGQSGQRLDFNREFVGQGVANMVGAFFQCFPAAGSFNRSAVCMQSGAKTRMAAILAAVFTALFLLWLGPLTNYIPEPAFAGLLMATAFFMIDRGRFMKMWRTSPHSRVVLAGTLAATLLLSMENAVFLGVLLSVLALLKVTGKPYLTQLIQRYDGSFEEIPFGHAADDRIVLVNLEGYFYFASVDDLDYELMQCITEETKILILRMKRLRAFGSSAMLMLEHFHDLLLKKNIRLMVCGIENDLRRTMTVSGLRQKLGEENIFYADNRLFQSTELALLRARKLLDNEKLGDHKPTLLEKIKGSIGNIGKAKNVPALNAGRLMSKRFLRFGQEHQIREVLWLLGEWVQSGKAGIRPVIYLQDTNGCMAGMVSLWEIIKDLGAHPDFLEAKTADARMMAEWFRYNQDKSIMRLVEYEAHCVSPESGLPEQLAALARNKGRSVPVLDKNRRMRGTVEAKVLLAELLRQLPDKENSE
ncbi:MAG: STAS domain-containing protein [Spirochaetes bacterium]|nr:STAS domain-containing protein [Spirochaetota bacterium]MBU0956261.1 STAS domain-containing protein [Spirochaetota bacterium]